MEGKGRAVKGRDKKVGKGQSGKILLRFTLALPLDNITEGWLLLMGDGIGAVACNAAWRSRCWMARFS